MFVILLISVAQNTKRLYLREPLPSAIPHDQAGNTAVVAEANG